MGDSIPEFLTFWGKALGESDGTVMVHSLAAHSLDVAAVALVLSRQRQANLPASTLAFLTALHDVGKFSRPFQGKVPASWPAKVLGAFPSQGVLSGPPHDVTGYALLSLLLRPALDHVFQGWLAGARGAVLRALAGHHGRPPATDGAEALLRRRDVLCDLCQAAASEFAVALLALLRPEPIPPPGDDDDAAKVAWHLAGLVTLADWVGSRREWFPYAAPTDLASYWSNVASPLAEVAVAAAGLLAPQPARPRSVASLFPEIRMPSPVQNWAASVALPEGPVLAVIEDLTGSGKTEASLILAHRLMAAGRVDGLFVALPTMATANAMYGRLSASHRRLFAEGSVPSLALAHGRARLDPRFRSTILPEPDLDTPAVREPADERGEAQCSAWLARESRRALLADVGVGTIDQALMAVLPVRFSALRLAGLARKVLVIDEAHAFDSYMRQEVLALLRFHAAMGGSAVVLSATLPKRLRQSLADAFRAGLGARPVEIAQSNYPLATLVAGDGVMEAPCAPRDGLPRRVAVRRLDDAEAAEAAVVAAAAGGAAVAWVRNTVDDAIAATSALRARGVEVLLFHARFAMADRLRIEAEVLRRFGRDSQGVARRCVVVGTQVIEQSLDLDFDLMVSDLAPADLLIQRAGRLWRHQRDGRVLAVPELLVVAPDPVDAPDAAWLHRVLPGTAAVYRDPALLWRGLRAILARGSITTPDDMRPLIEEAADAAGPGSVPEALAPRAGQAEGRALSQAAIAGQNVLRWRPAYAREAGLWEVEERTPTRLEEVPQATLRLALLRDGVVVPYAEDDDLALAWALSEVRVAAHRVAECPAPAELEAAVAVARAGWSRWERESPLLHCAVLMPHESGWCIAVVNNTNHSYFATYSTEQGLILPDRNKVP
jgi:CRISPR-associated endonuclease/helicase Cas3